MADGFSYSEQDHEHYQRLGFCTFAQFLAPAAVDEIRSHIERMLTLLQPGRKSDEIMAAHHQDRWLFELACEPKILDMIGRQIGPDIVLWSSALVIKPPGGGREVPWHQDAPYWNITGKLAGGIWLPLDDVDASNGAMCIVPGWHTKGTLARRKTSDNLFTEEIDPAALPADLECIKFQYTLKAGQAAVHDTMIPHNSLPNNSARWRRVIVLRYMSAYGELPPKMYENYRTGEKFRREGFLLRGRDVSNRGWRRSPFEEKES
jgi:hypothetical protein